MPLIKIVELYIILDPIYQFFLLSYLNIYEKIHCNAYVINDAFDLIYFFINVNFCYVFMFFKIIFIHKN